MLLFFFCLTGQGCVRKQWCLSQCHAWLTLQFPNWQLSLPFQKWSQVLLVVPPLRPWRGSTASKPHPRLWSHATIPGSWRVAGRFSAGMRIFVVIRQGILQGLQNMWKLWLCRCADSIFMRSGSSSSSSSVSSSRCRFILRFYNWINGSYLWFSLLTTFPIGPMIWWRRRDRGMRFMKTMWMITRLNMGSEHPNAFFCFPANHAIYLVVLSAITPRTLPTICRPNKRAMITIPTSPWGRTIRHMTAPTPLLQNHPHLEASHQTGWGWTRVMLQRQGKADRR